MATSPIEDDQRVFVLIQIAAPPEMEDETRTVFAETIATSHKPGFVGARTFEDTAAPGVLLSIQEWESEAAFRDHMSDSDEGLTDSSHLLAGPPILSVLRLIGEV